MAPQLQQVPMDKTLLDPPVETDRPTPSPMPPPSTPDNNTQAPSQTNTPGDKAPSTPKSDQQGNYRSIISGVRKFIYFFVNR